MLPVSIFCNKTQTFSLGIFFPLKVTTTDSVGTYSIWFTLFLTLLFNLLAAKSGTSAIVVSISYSGVISSGTHLTNPLNVTRLTGIDAVRLFFLLNSDVIK